MKEQWIVKLRHRVRHENSVKAPEGLLDDIKYAISERGMGPVTSPKAGKAIGRRWLYRVASVAALLAIGLFVYELSQLPQTTPSPTGKAVDIARLADIGPSVMEPTRVSSHKAPHNLNKRLLAVLDGTNGRATGEEQMTEKKDTDEACVRPNNSQDTPQAPQETVEEQDTQTGKSRRLPTTGDDWHVVTGSERLGKAQRQTVTPRLSVLASCHAGMGAATHSQGIMLPAALPYGDYDEAFGDNSASGLLINHKNEATRTRHRQPVKWGLSVSCRLTDRWSVQVGLTYSRLSSSMVYGKDMEPRHAEQTLCYVGIPLGIGYDLWKTQRFRIYAVAGGEVEKLVKGEIVSSLGGGKRSGAGVASVKESQPVFSLNAAMGAEYILARGLGAYIEPGVSHYFDNRSGVESIYKDKPTHLDVSVGLRLNLDLAPSR